MHKSIYAIFGGTFDPPHFGHLRPLQECATTLDLPSVALMPANVPAFKHKVSDSQHRIEMTRLLCELDPRFSLELIEFDRNKTSYTVDTLALLKQKYPQHTLVFILGHDAFLQVHHWHRWLELFDYAHLVVMARNTQLANKTKLAPNLYNIYTNSYQFDSLFGTEMDDKTRLALLSKLVPAESVSQSINQGVFMDIISTSAEGKLWFVNNTLTPVSSTEIRNAINLNKDCSEMIPDSIVEYINRNRLYRE